MRAKTNKKRAARNDEGLGKEREPGSKVVPFSPWKLGWGARKLIESSKCKRKAKKGGAETELGNGLGKGRGGEGFRKERSRGRRKLGRLAGVDASQEGEKLGGRGNKKVEGMKKRG